MVVLGLVCIWVGFMVVFNVVYLLSVLFLRYVGLVIVHVGVGVGGVASGGWVPAYLSLGALDGNRGDEVRDAVM